MRLGMTILAFAQDTLLAFDRMDNFERASLLRIVVSNFSLEGGKVRPDWKKPFDALAKKGQNERNYPLLEAFRTSLLGMPPTLGVQIERFKAQQLAS